MGFDYIICDSPAGIEKGAQMAMYFADEAIVVTNPEVSSVRDSDRVLGLLAAKTSRAEVGAPPIRPHLLLTRYSPAMVKRGEMLSVADVLELLGIPLLGVIPESKAVLQSSNKGTPAILDETTDVAQAYLDVVYRFLGQEREHRFIEEEKARLLRPALRLTQELVRFIMPFLDYFRRAPKSAALAKDRLSIIVARERAAGSRVGADYLPQLQQELLAVIARYEKIDLSNVTVNLDKSGGCEVLELNIVLPDGLEAGPPPPPPPGPVGEFAKRGFSRGPFRAGRGFPRGGGGLRAGGRARVSGR